ncbi:MAG TPA: ATP-binding protein [Candidatus Saccharimonadales bacterium]|nr:ATP-binding protein [Candidatus Saccharimonadales bacterium]
MYIKRFEQEHVNKTLNNGLVAILYGARQVGKTTLAKEIATFFKAPLYLNCDDPNVVISLTNKSAVELKSYIGNADLVIIDEGQRIENIGITIKLIHDTYPAIKLLVTGSSSLDLANKISEPLTGRSEEIVLYPFSVDEVSSSRLEMDANWRTMLSRGGYPAIWQLSAQDAYARLSSIANNYVYRDAFGPQVMFDQTVINDLLRLLAYQVGQEVSYGELAGKLSVSKETVMRYIDLLEKAFIIFRRNQYRRNQRVEVGRLRKVYFTDLGIRNAIIENFKPLETRDDTGALWENFCVVERLKYLQMQGRRVRSYYWRNEDQREIDIIEEEAGSLRAYECKFSTKKEARIPVAFTKMYPAYNFETINPENYPDKLLV